MASLLTIIQDDKVVLSVKSHKAVFRVNGTQLRWKKDDTPRRSYTTKDDLHVIGEVVRHLSAIYSGEVLKAALDEHYKSKEVK